VVFFEAPHRIRRTLSDLLDTVGDCQVLLARELTKVHEELVRGPISAVLERLVAPIGEITVVVVLGDSTEHGASAPPSGLALRQQLDEMTKSGGVDRRQAISALAKRYRIGANQVYRLIEAAKSSVK
jgi:16S rRNA (cytidine1402-2'-O)-methyltransferase